MFAQTYIQIGLLPDNYALAFSHSLPLLAPTEMMLQGLTVIPCSLYLASFSVKN